MSRKKQFLIFGLGRFGLSVLKTLSADGQEVLACDLDIELVKDASIYTSHVIQLDAIDEIALGEIEIGNFDVVFVCMANSVEASTLVILEAKDKGVKKVIAKAKTLKQKLIFEKIGADEVILPEMEMGERIANNIINPTILDYINIAEGYSIAEMKPKPNWINKSILELDVRRNYGLNIVVIKNAERLIVSPHPDELIKKGDILVVIGKADDIKSLKNR